MGDIVDLDHARASQVWGRSTSSGQSVPAGQLSENHRITSSYLRAVKVVEPSTTRSKKRQSPAAKRPKVVKLRGLASTYAEAQDMSFERSSVSITQIHSRKTPTTQAEKVGKFQLVENSDVSDNSAMRPVDQIRRRIQKALDDAKVGPITIAIELGWPRDHLRDYLAGKKSSLKTEKMLQLSDRFGIPFKELVIGGAKKETG